jgi:hypothetical protein
MSVDQLKNLSENNSVSIIKPWLKDLSELDGKCCYISKVSTLRAELVMMLNLSDRDHAEILEIFDKNLWINDGRIYEIKSAVLKELQEKIARFTYGQSTLDHQIFNSKDEVLKFTLNQSTLLALGIMCVIISRVIAKSFANIYYVDVILVLIYIFSIFAILPFIDKGTKKLSIVGMVVFAVIGLVVFVVFYPKAQNIKEYLSWNDSIALSILIIFNFGLICCYLFSSLHSMNIFATNHSKTPKWLFMILVLMIYALLIGVFMQVFSTIDIGFKK